MEFQRRFIASSSSIKEKEEEEEKVETKVVEVKVAEKDFLVPFFQKQIEVMVDVVVEKLEEPFEVMVAGSKVEVAVMFPPPPGVAIQRGRFAGENVVEEEVFERGQFQVFQPGNRGFGRGFGRFLDEQRKAEKSSPFKVSPKEILRSEPLLQPGGGRSALRVSTRPTVHRHLDRAGSGRHPGGQRGQVVLDGGGHQARGQ